MAGGVKGTKKAPSPYGRKDPKTGINPKQEQFCQNYVRGWDYVKAYKEAGYDSVNEATCETKDQLTRRYRRAAICLANRPAVKKRIDELQAEQTASVNAQRLAMTDKYAMNIERLTLMLLEDRHFARTGELALPGAEQIKDHTKGSDWRSDARAAVQATMGLAKLHGLLIDKAEITVQGSISRMSNEELLQFISKVHSEIGPIVEVTANAAPTAPRQIEAEHHQDADFAFPPKGGHQAPVKKR
jgi:phage terminase small subunit